MATYTGSGATYDEAYRDAKRQMEIDHNISLLAYAAHYLTWWAFLRPVSGAITFAYLFWLVPLMYQASVYLEGAAGWVGSILSLPLFCLILGGSWYLLTDGLPQIEIGEAYVLSQVFDYNRWLGVLLNIALYVYTALAPVWFSYAAANWGMSTFTRAMNYLFHEPIRDSITMTPLIAGLMASTGAIAVLVRYFGHPFCRQIGLFGGFRCHDFSRRGLVDEVNKASFEPPQKPVITKVSRRWL